MLLDGPEVLLRGLRATLDVLPLPNPDIYIPADKPGYTGYNQESNRGQRLEIRAGNDTNITVSFYFSLALGKPVITGGAASAGDTEPVTAWLPAAS